MSPVRPALLLAISLLLPAAGCESSLPRVSDHSLVVFAADGLEWRALLPLIRKGELPVIESLMEAGTYGRLGTLTPTSSAIIWTSVATGKTREKHGILDHAITDPATGKTRHFLRTDRRTKAVWNIFSDFGLKVHSVGWFKTFPVEKISGVMVSQLNTMFTFQGGKPGRLKPPAAVPWRHVVSPGEYAEQVAGIGLRVDQEWKERAAAIFGDAYTGHHEPLERGLWERSRWAITLDGAHLEVGLDVMDRHGRADLFLLYLRGFDVLGHAFWRYVEPHAFVNPPSPESAARYSGALQAYCRFLDVALGRVIDKAGRNATVLVLSDHGMRGTNLSGEFNPLQNPKDLLSGGHEEAEPGVFIAAGPGIRGGSPLPAGLRVQDLPIVGGVLDVAPTLLALKGLPVGEDMDGAVLTSILDDGHLRDHPLSRVASHDDLEGAPADPEHALSEEDAQDRLEELRSLGYVN